MGWCFRFKQIVWEKDKPWTYHPEEFTPEHMEKYKDNDFVVCGTCKDYRGHSYAFTDREPPATEVNP